MGFWCPSWTSNPVLPVTSGQGGFDSHTLPPFIFEWFAVLSESIIRFPSRHGSYCFFKPACLHIRLSIKFSDVGFDVQQGYRQERPRSRCAAGRLQSCECEQLTADRVGAFGGRVWQTVPAPGICPPRACRRAVQIESSVSSSTDSFSNLPSNEEHHYGWALQTVCGGTRPMIPNSIERVASQ
jgi:hypothetical protein